MTCRLVSQDILDRCHKSFPSRYQDLTGQWFDPVTGQARVAPGGGSTQGKNESGELGKMKLIEIWTRLALQMKQPLPAIFGMEDLFPFLENDGSLFYWIVWWGKSCTTGES